MKQLNGISGIEIKLTKASLAFVSKLPMYLGKTFKFHSADVEGKNIVLAELLSVSYTPDQLKKQHHQLENFSNAPFVFVIDHIEAYQRRRLVEKKIPFIVPGKQLYIPNLLIDLNDVKRGKPADHREKLSPAAQCLLLYHLQRENLDKLLLKIVAEKIGYSGMTVSRAAKELEQFSLCTIIGTKEKALDFVPDKKALWTKVVEVAINPVHQKVFANNLSHNVQLLQSSYTAMAHYTNLNEGKTKTFAIGKENYSLLKKQGFFKDINPFEGDYLIEVWNYNPELLSVGRYVDALSLFLSMREESDERTQSELEQLINSMKW